LESREEAMSKKELERLRATSEIKLSVLELAMITVALSQYIPCIIAEDKDGEALLEAYVKLNKRLAEEIKS
jgi:hypothetical protein